MSIWVLSPGSSDLKPCVVSMTVSLPLRIALTWTKQLFALALPLFVTVPVTRRNGAAGLVRLSVYWKFVLTRLGSPVAPFPPVGWVWGEGQ